IFNWIELMNSVYTGEVGSDLLKPMNFYVYWLARDGGRALAALLLRGVIIMLLFALVFPMTVPTSVARWLWVGTAVLLSWLVSFSYRFLVNLAAFWTPNARGI